MENEVRSYNIVFISNTQAVKGTIGSKGFIGEVVSLWEDHTRESALARQLELSIEHKVNPLDVELHLR